MGETGAAIAVMICSFVVICGFIGMLAGFFILGKMNKSALNNILLGGFTGLIASIAFLGLALFIIFVL